ncbi:MAG: preprotein translocase subunit SecE [Candidatus Dadabacteria bacterium]|nr:MAG: preprotein translocase subunit SecE [Candidatus Dadabacteria bacterium]
MFSDGISYFRSSWEELKKVTTPTRQETVQATMVVMLMMIIVAVYLGLLDLIFNKLMQSILS